MPKILIVDDEAHIRLLLEQTLEDLEEKNVEIFCAEDGKKALDLISKHMPELIFLDVMMPELNGYDVCKIVKKNPEYKNTYVIMLTAKGQEMDRTRGLDCGANEYITKPFDPDEILKAATVILKL